MDRRDLLRAFGAATALALLPRESLAAWSRVATGVRPADGLSASQLALVGAIADTIIPRTDSPSASDVGVPAFVDVIVTENADDAQRVAFVAGLDALGAHFRGPGGAAFVDLTPDERASGLDVIESLPDRQAEPIRTYWRLKQLIVHGYFTSEPVMKDVLKVQVMPGRFDGDAPMKRPDARPAERGAHV